MHFRTEYTFKERLFDLKYGDKVLSLGSCFADNMAQKLGRYFYEVESNPFGTLYNPVSIRNSLALLLNSYKFEEADLFEHKEQWHSFQHHSSFSNVSRETMLQTVNKRLQTARKYLEQADLMLLTFGTAWVYELKQSGRVVSNCHQLPANRFHRRRLTVAEIKEMYLPLIQYLKTNYPKLQLLFTVSPIRHLKDGLHENQLSKATLLLAIEALQEEVPDLIYFPAYELLTDDLRDYRFYAEDLVHPSSTGIEYVWERFKANCLSEKEEKLRERLRKIRQAMEHRPINPYSEQHQLFLEQHLKKVESLEKGNSALNLTVAKTYFNH